MFLRTERVFIWLVIDFTPDFLVISRLILCVRGGQIWRERQEEEESSDWLIPG